LRDLFPALAPLTPDEIVELISTLQSVPEINVAAAKFWYIGESLLHYTDHYCLAVTKILSYNT